MSIAYDNVKFSRGAEKWDMRILLSIATMLGIIGVISSFGILYIGKDIFHLSPEILRSFIYLKLSVAGHLTVFVARTKGPFWSLKPSKQVLAAVVITQLVATFITVYGFLLSAMGWGLAFFVWGYSLVAFFITDIIKVRLYWVLDHTNVVFQKK
jgi:H+-transporting ATPase